MSTGRPENDARGMTRRGFLGVSAAAAAGAAALSLGSVTPAFGETVPAGVTVPPGKRGIILFTVRDVVGRAPNPGIGVGGGFRYVFEQLSGMGYHEVEFAGYNQHTSILGRQITPAEIRQLLDDFGLVPNGSHASVPGTVTPTTTAQFEQQLNIAETLGMQHLGTGADPTSSPYKADWDRAAEVWNTWGAMAAARGIKLYTHNHDAAYNFLLDTGPLDALGRPTRSSGVRKLEYFFGIADPELVWFEMDIFWAYVAQFRWHTYTDADGVAREDLFDPIATVASQPHRFPLFHVKDGRRNPAVTNGYDMVPAGTGDVPLKQLLDTIGQKGYHHPNYEQDNAPGGTANPNQSLLYSQISYSNIASWRG